MGARPHKPVAAKVQLPDARCVPLHPVPATRITTSPEPTPPPQGSGPLCGIHNNSVAQSSALDHGRHLADLSPNRERPHECKPQARADTPPSLPPECKEKQTRADTPPSSNLTPDTSAPQKQPRTPPPAEKAATPPPPPATGQAPAATPLSPGGSIPPQYGYFLRWHRDQMRRLRLCVRVERARRQIEVSRRYSQMDTFRRLLQDQEKSVKVLERLLMTMLGGEVGSDCSQP